MVPGHICIVRVFTQGCQDQGRRAPICQAGGLVLRQPIARERPRGGPRSTRKLVADGQITAIGTFGRYSPPVLPAMELRQIVSAHDPDQAQTGNAGGADDDGIHSV